MSILRSSGRASLLQSRLAQGSKVPARHLCVSTVLSQGGNKPVLPARNWGSRMPMAASDTAEAHGDNKRVLPARKWGSRMPMTAFDTAEADMTGNRSRNRQGNNYGNQQGNWRSRNDGARERGGPGGQWPRNNRQPGTRSNEPQSQFGATGGAGPRMSWAQRTSSAQQSNFENPRTGFGRQPRERDDDPWSRPSFGDLAPPRTNAEDDFDGPDDDRHGRVRNREDSRSLLRVNNHFELPAARHHSDKGKGREDGARGGKASRRDITRLRDRGRAWDLEAEDNDDAAAARAALQKLAIAKAKRRAKEREKANAVKEQLEKDVYIPANITVAQLSEKFGVKIVRLRRQMTNLGMTETQQRADYILNADDASNLAIEFNLNPIIDEDMGFDLYPEAEEDISTAPLRPPVVTIMGHVDHGKTTLLDALRHTSVAAGEAGGITQHIGAFSVPLSALTAKSNASSDATITFLDTPGHAAFTGMRARGASVTDLVVLVVAADDGVMPQTKEVIELVKAEGDKVGLVVAINKCDKPMIDIERVKSNLGAEDVLLEEDGGEVPAVRVSGLARMGLDDLVETLSTLAEIRDLRARTDGKAEGWVLESNIDKGRGITATVLVTRGTLQVGSSIVAGKTWARVRDMTDSNGLHVDQATPGMPVSVTGWKEVPTAGDQLLQAVNGEDQAKRCIANRLRDAERRALLADAVAINARRVEDRERAAIETKHKEAAKEAGLNVAQALHAAQRAAATAAGPGKKYLNLVIKGDVSGTVEAVVGAVEGIGNKEAGVKIVHTGVGDVSESDIDMADASEGTVIAFNVACPRSLQSDAAAAGVPVHVESVIYRLIDTVRGCVAALLPPRIEYRITGEAVVQQIFEVKVSRKEVKKIAGCRVGNGILSKAEGVRVLRGHDREVVFEGTMETLKHLKKDVTEIRKGMECGVGIEGFTDLREGDHVVSFQKSEVAREL